MRREHFDIPIQFRCPRQLAEMIDEATHQLCTTTSEFLRQAALEKIKRVEEEKNRTLEKASG